MYGSGQPYTLAMPATEVSCIPAQPAARPLCLSRSPGLRAQHQLSQWPPPSLIWGARSGLRGVLGAEGFARFTGGGCSSKSKQGWQQTHTRAHTHTHTHLTLNPNLNTSVGFLDCDRRVWEFDVSAGGSRMQSFCRGILGAIVVQGGSGWYIGKATTFLAPLWPSFNMHLRMDTHKAHAWTHTKRMHGHTQSTCTDTHTKHMHQLLPLLPSQYPCKRTHSHNCLLYCFNGSLMTSQTYMHTSICCSGESWMASHTHTHWFLYCYNKSQLASRAYTHLLVVLLKWVTDGAIYRQKMHVPASCIATKNHSWRHEHTHTDTHTQTHTCLLYCSGESQLASYTKHAHTCLLYCYNESQLASQTHIHTRTHTCLLYCSDESQMATYTQTNTHMPACCIAARKHSWRHEHTHRHTHKHTHLPVVLLRRVTAGVIYKTRTYLLVVMLQWIAVGVTNTHTHTHEHTHTWSHTHAHPPACCIAPMSHRWQHIHKQTRTCLLVVFLQESTVGVTHTHTHTWTHTHEHTHTHTQTHTYANTHTCLLYCSNESQMAPLKLSMVTKLGKKGSTSSILSRPSAVCMCVYVYVCMCVCVYVYVCMCVCVYMCMGVWVYVCMCVCAHVCIWYMVYVCVCVYVRMCVYVCVYVCMYVCMCVCAYVR